jgi:hypothetical protein
MPPTYAGLPLRGAGGQPSKAALRLARPAKRPPPAGALIGPPDAPVCRRVLTLSAGEILSMVLAGVAATEASGGWALTRVWRIGSEAYRADAVSRSHLTSCCDPFVGRNWFTEPAPIVSVSLNGQPNLFADGSNLRLLAPSSYLTIRDWQALRDD